MLGRTGVTEEYSEFHAEFLAWQKFLPRQLDHIGLMSLPYALTPNSDGLHYTNPTGPWGLPYGSIGIGATGACLVGLLFAGHRRRLPLAALALSGLAWGLLLRNNVAFHSLESVFYIGIPLVLISMILLILRPHSRFLLPVISAVALAVFVLSSYQMGRSNAQIRDAEFPVNETLMSDFQEIRGLAQGNRVYMHSDFVESLSPDHFNMVSYYLTGSVIKYDETALPFCDPACEPGRDFVIGGEINPQAGGAINSLTPSNRLAFLYDAAGIAALYRAEYDTIRSGGYGPPIARSGFDVYMGGDKLIYYKEQCADADIAPKFSLHFYPRDVADLPAERREYKFDNRDFDFAPRQKRVGKACWATAPLPDYPIARVRTGQRIRGEAERLWVVEFPGSILEYTAAYQAIMSGGYLNPAARGNFEVYFSENRLVYIKEQCSDPDQEAKFYLHLVPQHMADLLEDRQPYGFNNPDFWFSENGAILDGDCVAIAPLPDYPIDNIRTGQFSGSNQLWRAELTGERLKYLASSEAIAVYSRREPAARAEWDVYIGDANRLVYRKESCAAADTYAKFYLHIIPRDVADLPADSREAGFANRDFWFAGRGVISGGKCLATAPLLDYDIARIRTGQHIPGQGQLWQADFRPGQ